VGKVFCLKNPIEESSFTIEKAARRVFISRDVLFFEQSFPFLQQNSGTHSPLPLPICDDIDNLLSLTNHNQVNQLPQQSSTSTQFQTFPDNPPVQHFTSDSSQHHAEAQPQDNSSVQNFPSLDTVFHPRKSTRSHKTPTRFQDYICSHTQTNWCNLVFAPSVYNTYLAAIEKCPEHATYE